MRREIAQRGMVLLDLKRRGERGSTVLEIVVDSEEGVTLDALAELSRWTGALLDDHEASLPGRYRLEVSSAGLDRPLEHLWQYRKNIGRRIKVTFDDQSGMRKTELFKLVDVIDNQLLIAPIKGRAASEGEPEPIALAHVVRAVIEPAF
ncbi:MAG: hypothetical protein JST22_14245 [Bacteroidetes bacterium]|nr:hypothetical protein [Bacteroidota bacterium]